MVANVLSRMNLIGRATPSSDAIGKNRPCIDGNGPAPRVKDMCPSAQNSLILNDLRARETRRRERNFGPRLSRNAGVAAAEHPVLQFD
jgi:hypothetical protein